MSKVIKTTKFGDLNFDGNELWHIGKIPLTNSVQPLERLMFKFKDTPYSNYTFYPSDIIEKGFVLDDKQYFNPNFLKYFDDIKEYGEFIDLAGIEEHEKLLKDNNLSTKGVLVPSEITGERNLSTVDPFGRTLWRVQPLNNVEANGRMAWNDIKGIGKVGDKYVYITNTTNLGKTEQSSGYYDETGSGGGQWKEKDKGGFLGKLARGFTEAIAAVPFLPEIVGIATANPYVYGSLKGAQTAGQGGDVGDVLKTGLLATGGALAAQQLVSAFPGSEAAVGADVASVGGTPGVSEVFPVSNIPPPTVTPIPPNVVLPPVDLLGTVTFPQQGFQVPPINSAEVALIPQGTTLPGQGLLAPTLPAVGAMGGAQGLSVGVPSGTITQAGLTPTGAVPVLGDPASFINNPEVLGQPVIAPETSTISLQQALRGARLASQLMNPPEQPGMPGMPMDQGGGMRAQGVDYSGLLSLMQGRVGIPNIGNLLAPAQIRYPNSLLG